MRRTHGPKPETGRKKRGAHVSAEPMAEALTQVSKKRKQRKWGSDEEVLAHARRFIEEKGMRSGYGLQKADPGLYAVLSRRGLLEQVAEKKEQRKWGTNNEVLAYARKFVEERGIRSRKELEKADEGLYTVLRKRRLLDRAFADIESAQHRDAVEGVLGAMETFGDAE